MIKLNKILVGNSNNIKQKSVFWNMMSGILSASQSSILMFFIIRIGGTYDSGIIAIAYAISYLMLTIGLFGMRDFQVTDVNQKFLFSDYMGSRIITVILMITTSLFYVLIKPYTFDKTMIVLSFCAFKMIDAIEDVYHGLYQQRGRLDIAGKAMSIRLALSTAYFISNYFITNNLVIASSTTFIFSLLIFVIINRSILPFFGELTYRFDRSKVKRLFIYCFPLFFAAFLNIYISNASKYAIDKSSSEEVQAYFGILFTPVFLIKLLSCFIYRPKLTSLAKEWNESNGKKFRSLILKQLSYIIGITFVIIILAYYFGTQLLTIFYAQDMKPYRTEFVILLIGGGMTAIVDFINTSLTIIRKQNILLIGYVIVTAFAMVLSTPVVRNYGLRGASILYTFMFGLLGVIFASYLFLKLNTVNRTKE